MDGLLSVFATLAVGALTLLMAGVQEEPGN